MERLQTRTGQIQATADLESFLMCSIVHFLKGPILSGSKEAAGEWVDFLTGAALANMILAGLLQCGLHRQRKVDRIRTEKLSINASPSQSSLETSGLSLCCPKAKCQLV